MHAGTQLITDAVTGAWSRAHLKPRIEQELLRAARNDTSLSVFLFDVDFFKTVNDAYGHLRGDAVLRQIAESLRGLVRGYDALFRYGGDEFVLLLPATDRVAAVRLALRVTEEIRRAEFPGDPPLRISISLGVATFPDDAADVDGLLACADRRNYLAKRRGRGSVVADDSRAAVDPTVSRLWERESALATAHEFLTALTVEGRGALRVAGQPGAGHTRFLQEVGSAAADRGFLVVPVRSGADPGTDRPTPEPVAGSGVLLLVDTDAAAQAPDAVHAWRDGSPVLGVVYAEPGAGSPAEPPLPVLRTADLPPWSQGAVRLWLRETLGGEPSRALLTWLAGHSRGLPARAGQELQRLRNRGHLVCGDGGWTLAQSAANRTRRKSRLPAPITSLVGRERELAEVTALLGHARLVTLVGPGGIGKTRLSTAAAAAVSGKFDDGAVFVPLAEATGTDQVLAAVSRALQVDPVPGEPLLDTLIEQLAEASVLLVLDNFEQVLQAGPAVGELLAEVPGLTVLATSRESLALIRERVYAVPPLPLPDLAALPSGAAGVTQALADSPAVALFDERARAANPDFTLSPQTLPTVAQLCRRLDGLPLAIELAAARIDEWTPDELLARLTDHFDALSDGPRDRPERQQTLRGAIDWSFRLLMPAERQLFAALAVFRGGCTLDSALEVTQPGLDGEQPSANEQEVRRKDLAGRLAALAAKSLLVVEAGPAGAARYAMLETIAAYAADALAAEPRAAQTYTRHARHYADFAEASAVGLTGPEQAEWGERLEVEYQNLRAAIGWALRQDAETATRICLGLWRYWRNGNHPGEGREWLDRLLATTEGRLPDDVRARILTPAAVLAATEDDNDAALRLAEQALALAEAVGDRQTAAQARNALGIACIGLGEYAAAAGHFRESLAIWRELDQSPGTAIALGNLTKVSLRLGDIAAAESYANQVLDLERAAGNTRGIVLALECLAQIRLAQGDLAAAREAVQESLALSRTLGDILGEAMALHQLGVAAYAEGAERDALRLLLAALAHRHAAGDREDLAVSLDWVGKVMAEADPDLSIRLLAAAGAVRDRYRLPVPPETQTCRKETVARILAAVDPVRYASAWAAGLNTPLDVVVAQTLDLLPAEAPTDG